MNYFLDTEFQEGFHKPTFGKRRHFIDLISIGIVAEDGREYYAVSNEFDLKKVWKDDWLRKNVLYPVYMDLFYKESQNMYSKTYHSGLWDEFNFKCLHTLIRWYGKSNAAIAEGVESFCLSGSTPPVFYGYYADYDWVLLCSLFGRMIDLPKSFPMYCNDLKQIVDMSGLDKEWVKSQCPEPVGQLHHHHALCDAKWNKELFIKLVEWNSR